MCEAEEFENTEHAIRWACTAFIAPLRLSGIEDFFAY